MLIVPHMVNLQPKPGQGTLLRLRRASLLIVGLSLILQLPAGCGAPIRHYCSPNFPSHTPFRIAVLPLTNLSGNESAGEVMGNTLTMELMAQGAFTTLDPSLVNTVLSKLRIRYPDRMNRDQLSALSAELDVDGILVGTVNAFEYRASDGVEYPLVSVHTRIISLPAGEILWMADASRRGNDHEFILGIGLVELLPRLGQELALDIFDTLPDKVVRK